MDAFTGIRTARMDDLEAMRAIYNYYITHSNACLAWQPHTQEEFEKDLLETGKDYPVLAAVKDGKVIGFGYASRWLAKEAYQFAAELTIYFQPGNHYGLAKSLLQELEQQLKEQNIRWMISCTTASNHESLRFQKDNGFQEFGRLKEAGWKEGEWSDV